MKIATVVQGRIFGFDLARGLLTNGAEALLLTNYPKWAVEKFDLPREIVRCCPAHGVMTRVLSRVLGQRADKMEPFLHRWFGTWAARVLRDEPMDAVQVFSGVAEETFAEMRETRPEVTRLLIRASTHIKTQRQILAAEQQRLGSPVEQPSAWRIAREVREYQLADRVMLLSGFTHQSFLNRGYNPERLIHLPMGADVGTFEATPSIVSDRAERIEHGEPLRVLIVGTFSARKGAKDMVEVAKALAPTGIQFRFIGAVAPDAAHLEAEARRYIEFCGFQPQSELPKWYAQGDVFFFPTLEDGFPAVLAQALTGVLPLLTTPNSSAADLIVEGRNGWIKQPRDTAGFIEQLRWCDTNRPAFAKMISSSATRPYRRDWPEVSRELIAKVEEVRAHPASPKAKEVMPALPRRLLSPDRPLRIAVVAHGRFHAFDLCRALQKRDDVEVTLVTNMLPSQITPFGIGREHFRTMPLHRLAHKIFYHFVWLSRQEWLEPQLYQWFGRFAARQLERMPDPPDVIRVFSSVAEEILRSEALAGSVRIVTRGSSHILAQRGLLDDEEARAGVPLLKPSDFLIDREQNEYDLADCVQVVSRFAERTFIEKGHSKDRLWLLPNSVNVLWYGADEAQTAERRRRVLAGEPLRVLIVGAFSYRKGVKEIIEVAHRLKGRCQFRFVGDVPLEAQREKEAAHDLIEFRPRVSPQALKAEYAWGDVFLLPTIEDGFPATLTQALAGGLAAITTPNGSGPDLIQDGMTGWIVPIRNAPVIIQRLEWLDTHRQELLAAGEAAAQSVSKRSWDQVADEFVVGLKQRWPHLATKHYKKAS